MKHRTLLVGTAAALYLIVTPALAADASTESEKAAYNQTFVTHHAGIFGGQKVKYTATVGSTILTSDAGQPEANFVSVAYVRDGVADPSTRPVIFLFAGGPSGAAVYYHMTFMGPKQLIGGAPGADGQSTLRDNPDALLDLADLVFVDPAETGFSRILTDGKRSYFYSVNGDTASIEQFMGRWLKAHDRESSPRYVMGGSYGSVRAIRIAWDSRRARPIDGVIMTANSLMLQEMVGVVGNVLPLPTYATVAIYHKKAERRGRTDEQVVEETYRFAIDEYLPALARVQDLSPEQRGEMAEKLHRITGMPAADILAKNLVITREDFMEGLLKDEDERLDDRLDGRKTVAAVPAQTSTSTRDRVYEALQTYMAHDLGVTYPMSDYRASAPDTKQWDYHAADGGPQNDWPEMTRAFLETNPHAFVYSANGLYDLQGVMGQARWLLSRTPLPRDRFFLREYPGGHALYTDPPTAEILLKELRKVFQQHTWALGSDALRRR